MAILVLVLAAGTAMLWYLPCVHAQGDNRALKRGDYWRAGFFNGFLYASLLIMVTEIAWDKLIARTSLSGLKL